MPDDTEFQFCVATNLGARPYKHGAPATPRTLFKTQSEDVVVAQFRVINCPRSAKRFFKTTSPLILDSVHASVRLATVLLSLLRRVATARCLQKRKIFNKPEESAVVQNASGSSRRRFTRRTKNCTSRGCIQPSGASIVT